MTRSEHNAGRRPAQRHHRRSQRAAEGASSSSTRKASAPMAAVRIEQVVNVLDTLLSWQWPADAVLSQWFRQHPKAGARDRGEIAEAVYDILRHLRLYRHWAQSGRGPEERRLAVLGLSSALPAEALEPGLQGHERAWLEHLQTLDLFALPRALRFSLPDWLDERLAQLPEADALCAALNRPAALDLRVNPYKISRAELLDRWVHEPEGPWVATPTPYSPWGIRLQGRPAIQRWKAFAQGEIEVQDEGSQLLALLVAPRRGEMVIDYCAGAGGKTLLLGALMRSTGRLYAFDISAARLARAKPRFARSGLSNITPVVISPHRDARVARLHGKAHRVLVDAPCSGLGTLRRNPDLKWRQTPEAIEQMRVTQAALLREAARCLRSDGRLVYATCSLLPEENEHQVEAFLADHPNFSLLSAADVLAERGVDLNLSDPYLRLRPDQHDTDGFFAAVLQKSP